MAHENHIKLAKAAPWSQSNTSHGTSLAEIQKAEREKRAEQAALLQQKIQQSQEPVLEKNIPPQFSWASKPILPRQVKSLAEIQAEEQERLAKVFDNCFRMIDVINCVNSSKLPKLGLLNNKKKRKLYKRLRREYGMVKILLGQIIRHIGRIQVCNHFYETFLTFNFFLYLEHHIRLLPMFRPL